MERKSSLTNLLETLEYWTEALDQGYGVDSVCGLSVFNENLRGKKVNKALYSFCFSVMKVISYTTPCLSWTQTGCSPFCLGHKLYAPLDVLDHKLDAPHYALPSTWLPPPFMSWPQTGCSPLCHGHKLDAPLYVLATNWMLPLYIMATNWMLPLYFMATNWMLPFMSWSQTGCSPFISWPQTGCPPPLWHGHKLDAPPLCLDHNLDAPLYVLTTTWVLPLYDKWSLMILNIVIFWY